MMWFNKKKMKISEISKFSIWPYKQNQRLRNIRKVLFALNFDCFNCIKRQKAENFH